MRVGGEVLQRLLQPVAIADDGLRARLDRRLHRDARRLARALVPRARRDRTARRPAPARSCSAPPPPSSRARSSRSPMMRSSRLRLVADDRQIARPRRLVQRQLRHRQRLEVAAHRGHRRRQLVRDVGEQLAADAVGGGQRVGARREVVGHRVERARDRGDFVAAAIGRARRQVAGAETGAPPFRAARSRRRAGPKISTESRARCRRTSTPAATSASIGAKRPSRNPNGACGGTTTTPASRRRR